MRLLLPEQFGVFALATTIGSYIGLLRAFDFKAPVIAAKKVEPPLLTTQFNAEVSLCVLNFLIALVLVPWLSKAYGNFVILVTLALLFMDGIDASYSTFLYQRERDMQFPVILKWKTAINFLSFGITIWMAWKGFGVWALVVDRAIVSLFLGFMLWSSSSWRPSWKWDRDSLLYLAKFGGALFVCGLFGKILFGVDQLIIGSLWSELDLGYYSRALVWAQLPMNVGSGFLSLIALAFYSSEARRSDEAAQKAHDEMTFNISRITMWMTGCMALLFSDVVPLLFGKNWGPIVPIFIALIPYAVSRPLFQNTAQALTSLHEQAFFTRVIVWVSILEVVLLALFQSYGILWIAVISGGVLVLGYLLLEWRVAQRLGRSGLHHLSIPVGMLMVALCGIFIPKLHLSAFMNMAVKLTWTFVYSAVVYLEWRRSLKSPRHRPAS
jgi:teichuronic acid exporter